MNIASRRALPAFAFLTLALSACGKSNTPAATAGDAPTLESHELRSLLQIADMQALPATPQVDAELYDLGHALFFDKVLSGNRDVSCATCHWPDLGSADDRTLPLGVGGVGLGKARTGGAIVPRNSPAILNTHLLDQMFWDGRVEHSPDGVSTPAGEALTPEMRAILDPRWELLAAQAMFPPTSRHEMRGEIGESELGNIENKNTAEIWDKLTQRLMDIPEYQRMFLAAYPDLTSISEVQFAHAANAIAAFEVKAFAHTDSPFERFVKGDDEALTDHQIEGAREFFGDAGCAQCHSGNTFTDSDFHNIGLPQFGPGKGDGASKLEDFGRERVTGSTADRYQIRTASLLNIALTGPPLLDATWNASPSLPPWMLKVCDWNASSSLTGSAPPTAVSTAEFSATARAASLSNGASFWSITVTVTAPSPDSPPGSMARTTSEYDDVTSKFTAAAATRSCAVPASIANTPPLLPLTMA